MKQGTHESLSENEDVVGCDVSVFSADRRFINHYRAMFMSLGFRPITVTTPEAALATLRLTVVAFVVVDQESGTSDNRRILERARETQQHAPVLVIAQKPNPDSCREALVRGAESMGTYL